MIRFDSTDKTLHLQRVIHVKGAEGFKGDDVPIPLGELNERERQLVILSFKLGISYANGNSLQNSKVDNPGAVESPLDKFNRLVKKTAPASKEKAGEIIPKSHDEGVQKTVLDPIPEIQDPVIQD